MSIASVYFYGGKIGIATVDTTKGGAQVLRKCDVVDESSVDAKTIGMMVIEASDDSIDGIEMPMDYTRGYCDMLIKFGCASSSSFNKRAKCIHIEIIDSVATIEMQNNIDGIFVPSGDKILCSFVKACDVGDVIMKIIGKWKP